MTDTPVKNEERVRLEGGLDRKLGLVLRMSCDCVTEVHLEAGRYTQRVFGEQGAPAKVTHGDYMEHFRKVLSKAYESVDAQLLGRELSLEALRRRWREGNGGRESAFYYRLRGDGRTIWLECRSLILDDGDGVNAYILTDDVSERLEREHLQKPHEPLDQEWLEEERYHLVLQQRRTVVFEYDLSTGENYLSPTVSEYLAGEYDERDLFAVLLGDGVVHPLDEEKLQRFCGEICSQAAASTTVRLRGGDGVYRWHRIITAPVAGDTLRILGSVADVDEETKSKLDLQYRAEFDGVTGIYNQVTFYRRARELMQSRPDCVFRIVRFDISHFKMVNDLFGVVEGDRLLHFTGQLIRSKMNGSEVYARLGDDVFCLCVSRSDEETVQLIEELGDEMALYPLEFRVVLHAGIYRVDEYGGEPVNVLCDRANLAQKTVKGSFDTRCAFYEDRMGQELFQEQEILAQAQRALLEEQFTIYLQPKVDMRACQAFGAEALVRWKHPNRGTLPPGHFIPVFEKSGFIIRLDEYVWELACQTLRRWIDRGLEPLPISVNVSRVHLYNPSFCDTLVGLTEKYGLPPKLLELELTESAYTDNPHQLYEAMERLQGLGFAFLMDDFGSGYSSLNMLKDVAVDALKIDLNFIRELKRNGPGRVILESTIAMARKLGLPMIAEGIETADQASFLLEAGCTNAQGYYYSRPLPIEEFERHARGRSMKGLFPPAKTVGPAVSMGSAH